MKCLFIFNWTWIQYRFYVSPQTDVRRTWGFTSKTGGGHILILTCSLFWSTELTAEGCPNISDTPRIVVGVQHHPLGEKEARWVRESEWPLWGREKHPLHLSGIELLIPRLPSPSPRHYAQLGTSLNMRRPNNTSILNGHLASTHQQMLKAVKLHNQVQQKVYTNQGNKIQQGRHW